MGEFFDILGRNWQPGIGDPTVMGWLTVVAYFAAAGLLFYKRRRASFLYFSHLNQHRRLLLVMALIMIALGINKELDLQTWVTDVGRDLAEAQGWYEKRRAVQMLVLCMLGIVAVGLGFVILKMRGVMRSHRTGLLGMLVLVGFVLMRASSFFKVDRLLGLSPGGIKLNWLFELGGIGIVIYSVVKSLRALALAGRTGVQTGGQ